MTNLDFMKGKMKSKIDQMNAHQIARIMVGLIGFPNACEYCDYAGKEECGIDCEAGFVKWLEMECKND